MTSLAPPVNPLFVELTLRRIFSFLDETSRGEARRVHPFWNEVAQSLPRDVTIPPAKPLEEAFPLLRVQGLGPTIRRLTLTLRRRKDLNCFLQALRYSQFPKLEELVIFIDPDACFGYLYPELLPPPLLTLKTLELRSGVPSFHDVPLCTPICQQLLSLTPNITSLVTNQPLDLTLSSLPLLTHLTFQPYERADNFSLFDNRAEKAIFMAMLTGVKDSLLYLSVEGIYFPTTATNFPVFPLLEELRLQSVYSFDENMAKLFPNLKKLNTSTYIEDAVFDYLKTRPQSLVQLQTSLFRARYKCNYNFLAVDFYTLIQDLPNLETLIVHGDNRVGRSVLGDMEECLRQELIDVLNLKLPRVVLRTEHFHVETLPQLFKVLKTVEIEAPADDNEKGEVLEFQFPERDLHSPSGWEGIRKKDGDVGMMKEFGEEMRKLARRWKLIKIKGFLAPQVWINGMNKQIRKGRLPVQLFFGVVKKKDVVGTESRTRDGQENRYRYSCSALAAASYLRDRGKKRIAQVIEAESRNPVPSAKRLKKLEKEKEEEVAVRTVTATRYGRQVMQPQRYGYKSTSTTT